MTSSRPNTLFGVSVKIRQEDYEQYYKAGERPKKVPLDTMYGLCFRYLIVFISDIVEKTLKRDDIENCFVIEAGHKNAGDAARIFGQIKKDADKPSAFRSVAFERKKSLYALQGADLFSHTAYLAEQDDEDEMELTDFSGDNLFDAKKQVKHKSPLFRGVLGPELLQKIKENKLAWERERIEFGKRKKLVASPNAASASAAQSSET